MSGWQDDKAWSDRFIPNMKAILGWCLFAEADLAEDQLRNTDLIVFQARAFRVGCRVRRHGFLAKYPNDITIRASRPGADTEVDKMLSGWGDFFLYGFSDEAERRLKKWVLCDLAELRKFFVGHMRQHEGALPGQIRANGDGSSEFLVLSQDQLPAAVRFKTSDDLARERAMTFAQPAHPADITAYPAT